MHTELNNFWHSWEKGVPEEWFGIREVLENCVCGTGVSMGCRCFVSIRSSRNRGECWMVFYQSGNIRFFFLLKRVLQNIFFRTVRKWIQPVSRYNFSLFRCSEKHDVIPRIPGPNFIAWNDHFFHFHIRFSDAAQFIWILLFKTIKHVPKYRISAGLLDQKSKRDRITFWEEHPGVLTRTKAWRRSGSTPTGCSSQNVRNRSDDLLVLLWEGLSSLPIRFSKIANFRVTV